MARAAGVDAIGVGCGVHDAARLRRAGALEVLDSVETLPDWLACERRSA
jgi:phosphoglycolate phosphatase-like HAD superfamily hydrolase